MNIFVAAKAGLLECSVEKKVKNVYQLYEQWQAGMGTTVLNEKQQQQAKIEEVTIPGRPIKPELVHPKNLKKRKLGSLTGKAAAIHAFVHIEFNAINLALDNIYRFRGLPDDFYTDWITIAKEEAWHYSLLVQHLQDMGFQYGDFPAHNGLWEISMQTNDSLLRRMALVPRVLEARGLDVTPTIMEKFRSIGAKEIVDTLAIILRDEITHVAAGSRWFRYACEREKKNPEAIFMQLIKENSLAQIKKPLHIEARKKAGFNHQEMQFLQDICGR